MNNALPIACAVSLALALSTNVASAQAPDYDAAMSAAAQHEQAGHPREAAQGLEALGAAFPEDHALALRLGWLWFQARDWSKARAHYTRALALSAGASAESRLGLAWSLLRLGEVSQARQEFERVVAQSPDDASAREGLALARAAEPRPLRAWASLWAGAQLYSGHPSRRYSYSVSPSLTLQFNDLLVFGATYRLVNYDYVTRQPGRRPFNGMAVQQEAFFSAGVARERYAVRLHLGYVWDANSTMMPAYVVGLSSRFAWRGEVLAEASGTVFRDYTAVRAAASWDIALADAWTLGPLASAQYGNGAAGGSLGARVGLRHRLFTLSLAGRFGDELRPTSLNESLAFATNDHVRATVTAAGRVPLGRGYALVVSYDWMRLTTALPATPATPASTTDSDAHFLSAGITGAW